MAESADILTDDSVTVILPDLSAGCSMADMADLEQVEQAWDFLAGTCGEKIIPITYVNSAASIKAFCGEHGGACCTSSNASAVLRWAFEQHGKVLFLPDQHLGRNTAYAMGVPLDDMSLYDPHVTDGGLTTDRVKQSRVLLWKGHCSVHGLFSVKQCEWLRKNDPDCRLLVHPECSWEVVQASDLSGSTEFIIRTVDESPPGSRWAIGTEVHLVNRLAHKYPDKLIRSLSDVQCLCTTMYRIDPKHLLWTLDELVAGRVVNQIRVDGKTREFALIALERMLSHVPSSPVAIKS
jgi:quinolinate synthase